MEVIAEQTRVQLINDRVILRPAQKNTMKANDIFNYEVVNTIESKSKFRILTLTQNAIWRFLFSPLLLLSSFTIYIFIPVRIFKRKLNKVLSYKLDLAIKRFFDITGALIILIPVSILFLVISLLIKLDSPGTVLYTQTRVGHNRRRKTRREIDADIYSERRNDDRRKENLYGKPFVIYKFRTMRMDAENKCGPVWATKNDPRITIIGNILRYTHLDELPQLINILKGEMSFVGPRPERPFFVNQFVKKIPEYTERLKTKPGLTGLAQVQCGYDHSIEDVKHKLQYDLRYCQNGNIFSYFKIIFMTITKQIYKL